MTSQEQKAGEGILILKSQAPFHVLGYDQGNFYFLPHSTHEIIVLAPDEMVLKKTLLRLAPPEWWKEKFKGVDLSQVCNELILACYARGVFSECRLFQSMLYRQREMGWFE